jgi:outer membrane protein TolC
LGTLSNDNLNDSKQTSKSTSISVGLRLHAPIYSGYDVPELRKQRFKLKNAQTEIDVVEKEIRKRLKDVTNRIQSHEKKIKLHTDRIKNLKSLLISERRKKDVGLLGEKDLKKREISYLNTQRQMLDISVELYDSRLDLLFLTNSLGSVIPAGNPPDK